MSQKALRRHAQPIVAPVPGTPLVKVTATLGHMQVWRKARHWVPVTWDEDHKKQEMHWAFDRFVEWMRKEDRAQYAGQVRLSGPFPHFTPKEPDTQYGDNGAQRKVARSIAGDTAPSEFEDYIIEALFNVPERLSEIPTDLALDLFTGPASRPGLRPLREREWRERVWSRRQ